MNTNYQIQLNKKLEEIKNTGKKPKLLIHSCCAPCSSYVLTYLIDIFDITLLFYNPNIYPDTEYMRRASELKHLLKQMNLSVNYSEGDYDKNLFYVAIKGMEHLVEGSERCFACYKLRLNKAAEYAKLNGFDYFTTTLTISPHKNAAKLNELGEAAAHQNDVRFLSSDFKKNSGYQKSIELSKQYNLYRQDYCGCIYSYQNAKNRKSFTP